MFCKCICNFATSVVLFRVPKFDVSGRVQNANTTCPGNKTLTNYLSNDACANVLVSLYAK